MRVLLVALRSDDLGLPSRLLPIAAELRARGHQVAFACPNAAPAMLVGSAGFLNLECPQMRSSGSKLVAEPTPLVRDYDHFLALLGWCDHEFTDRQIQDCASILRAWSPDIVVDSFDAGWCAAARITGIPYVEVLQGDLHPDGHGFTWWLPLTAASPTPAAAFNAALARAGLPAVDKAARLLLGDATVVVGSSATDPVPDARLAHVGALVWGDPAARLPAVIPPPGRRPLIFLYGGKPRYAPGRMVWCDSAVVLETCIQALGEMDADVVVGAGHQELPPLLPANFIPLPYAPGQALARRADVLIHHGGHGSTLTALAAGTPALIIPTYSERESNARRAAALGAALYLVPETQQCGRQHEQPIASSSDLAASDRKLEPARVADAITTLLAHSRYADSAKTAAKELAALPGASGAADIIEAVAPATSSRRRQRIAGASDSLRRG